MAILTGADALRSRLNKLDSWLAKPNQRACNAIEI